VESSLLMRLRASVAGCCVVSTSGIDAGIVPVIELPVRLRLDGGSPDEGASGVTEEFTNSEFVMLGARVVLRTEFSSDESLCTKA
jgi:hypothetical protein